MNVIGLRSFVDSTIHPIACYAPFLFYSHATTVLPWRVTYFFRCYLWCTWVDWLCRRLILGAWVTNWYLPSITDLLLSSAHLRSRVYYLFFLLLEVTYARDLEVTSFWISWVILLPHLMGTILEVSGLTTSQICISFYVSWVSVLVGFPCLTICCRPASILCSVDYL